jgi:aminoglycoside 3-N-acetyltransferase
MSNKPFGQGEWDARQLREQLAANCGVKAGDALIVHSSLKSLGHVRGGAEAVVAALREALTPEGTLLMPVFCQPPADGVFRAAVTPSRLGAVSEAFRRTPGVVRSLHPTHSVGAWGRRAEEFTAGHELTTGLGVGSPFHKAAQAEAMILMIGCDIRSCSIVHVAEALLPSPYFDKVIFPDYDRTFIVEDAAGRRLTIPPKGNPSDSAGFWPLQAELERRGQIAHCRLGGAECVKFSAATCLETAMAMLRQNPAALLCEDPSCAVCVKARGICRKKEPAQSEI